LKEMEQISICWMTIPQNKSPHPICSIYKYTIMDYISDGLKKITLYDNACKAPETHEECS
jgi:hypothetical protein